MIDHTMVNEQGLRKLIRENKICYAGNKKLLIYGTLKCKSGKRMKKQHRVFFSTQKEALEHGYRPCGNCMKAAFKEFSNR